MSAIEMQQLTATTNPATLEIKKQEVAAKVEAVEAARHDEASPDVDSVESVKDLSQAVDTMNEFASLFQRNLSFSVDEQSGRNIIKVKDTSSNEVIRQIPSEEVLALLNNMEKVRGLILKTEV